MKLRFFTFFFLVDGRIRKREAQGRIRIREARKLKYPTPDPEHSMSDTYILLLCLDKFNRRAPACEREDTDDLLWQQGGPPYHHHSSSSTLQHFAKTEDLLTIRRWLLNSNQIVSKSGTGLVLLALSFSQG